MPALVTRQNFNKRTDIQKVHDTVFILAGELAIGKDSRVSTEHVILLPKSGVFVKYLRAAY